MREKKTPKRSSKPLEEGKFKAVPIKHIFPQGQMAAFSNHITVQHSNEGEFTLCFFDIRQPLVLGEQGDREKLWEAIETAEATCVARIVISAARMPRLIGALITNYEIFERDTGKSTEGDADESPNKKHAS
jgi:hypothetical protein